MDSKPDKVDGKNPLRFMPKQNVAQMTAWELSNCDSIKITDKDNGPKYTAMVPRNFEQFDDIIRYRKLNKIVEHFNSADKKRTGLSLFYNGEQYLLGNKADSYVNRSLSSQVNRVVVSEQRRDNEKRLFRTLKFYSRKDGAY